jgi:hypothetical protein
VIRILGIVISGLVGAGIGALSGRILFGGSAWNLIPWGIGAVAIGLIADDRRTALLAFGAYGYLLSAVPRSSHPVGETSCIPSVERRSGVPYCRIAFEVSAAS